MREIVDAERIRRLMRSLGLEARDESKVYLVGGATAVLLGWRESTIDVDLKLVPEDDRVLRSIPALKESLRINLELAAPDQFIPPLPGWEGRSPYIGREGKLSFFHYDLYSQALAKLERGHTQDLSDVKAMLDRNLVDRARLLDFFTQIEPHLYRYPAVDPAEFRKTVEDVARGKP